MTILSSLFSYGLYQFILCGPVFVTLVSDYLSMPSEACLWCIWFLVIFVSTPFMRSASFSQYIPKRKRSNNSSICLCWVIIWYRHLQSHATKLQSHATKDGILSGPIIKTVPISPWAIMGLCGRKMEGPS